MSVSRGQLFALVACLASMQTQAGVPGQAVDRLRFERVEASEDLASIAVLALAQDSFGFLWVGTRGGLYRFDGVAFREYRSDSNDARSLANNWVNDVFVDREETVWIRTNRGLCRYDATSDDFVNYSIEVPGGMAEDASGRLLVVSEAGSFFEYDRATDAFVALPGQVPWLVKSMSVDSQNRVWVGGRGGLARLDEAFAIVERVLLPVEARDQEVGAVISIEEDARGRILYAAYGYGVWSYEPGSGEAEPLLPPSAWKGVTALVREDDAGNIYVGSTAGLAVLQAETGELKMYQHDEYDSASIPQGDVYSLLIDAERNLWVGTTQGGLAAAFNRKAFEPVLRKLSDPSSLTKDKVTSILVDSRDRLWVGYHDDGLDMIVESEDRKRYFDPYEEGPDRLGLGTIYDLEEDDDGSIWVASNWSGLQRLDPETGESIRFAPDPGDPQAIAGSDVRRIVADDRGNFWLGLHGVGVDYFDREAGTFSRLEGYERRWVEDLALDDRGGLWIASSDGLDYRSPETGDVVSIGAEEDELGALSDPHVKCLLIDSAGLVWVGTANGLDRIDAETGRIESFDVSHGLPAGDIRSLLESDEGEIWIGTARGLAVYYPLSGRFVAFDKSDGLQTNEMVIRAAFKTGDGRMLFGSERGIVRFRPSEIEPNDVIPPVALTGIRVFNDRLPIDERPDGILRQAPWVTETLVLPPGHKSFGFEFAALSFLAPEKNRYAYMLEGFDKQWIDNGSRRECSYTNIEPGTYTFRVKASSNDGFWDGAGYDLTVIVEPYYWETLWFKTLVALALAAAMVAIYLYRVRRLADQKSRLEVAVAERTRLLRQAFVDLEGKNERIEEQNLELRDHRENLEELVAQRTEELEKAKDRAEISDRLKSSFLENVSHEIRTPMNSIIGFLSLLKHKSVPDTLRDEYTAIIERNGRALLVLIDDILDLSRMQSEGIELQEDWVDVSQMFADLELYYREISGVGHPDVEIILEHDDAIRRPLVVWGDGGRIRQIVNNLMDNAVKFTESGEIRFGYRLGSAIDGKRRLRLHVEDSGVGIPEDMVSVVYDRFRKVEGDLQKLYRGTGLGLAIVKKLVELMNGSIELDSKLGEGTRFRVTIPVGVERERPDEP